MIRVSGDPDWAPIDFTLPGGKHSGLSEDLLTRMGDRLGVSFVYQPSASWEEAVASLQRGDIDLLCAVGRSVQQEQQFSLSRPYLRFRNVIVGRRDGQPISSLAVAAGKTFALVPSYTETGLALNAQPQLKVLAVADTAAALEAVAAGRAEATLGNPAVLGYALRSRGLANLSVSGIADDEEKTVHFAARKREPELAALINTGLAALSESEQSGLRGRWFSETAVGGTPNGLELTADERAAVVQHRRLEVVIDPNRAPFSFLDAQGNAVGLLPELLAKVAALLGTELHFQHLSRFQEVIPRLADGRITLVGGVRHLPELEQQLSYSAEVYAVRPTLFTRQPVAGSVMLDSFAGQRFAVPEGASSRAYLQQHLPSHIEVPSTQYGEALTLLMQGKVDVVLGNPGNILFAARQQNINGLHAAMTLPELFRGIYLATSETNPALASAIGKAYAVIPPAELNAIRRRWLDIDSLGSSYPQPSQRLAESERVFIAAHPVLRVGYNDWLPIIYRDGEGNPAGVAADVMQLVAQRTGLKLEWLHFSNWESSKVALQERRVDLLAAHGVPTFNAAISFTSPYANLQSVIVTRAGMPYIAKFSDLRGRTVGVVLNSLEHDELLRHYPQQPRREASDSSQLLQMIASNQVDVGLGSDAAMVSGIRRLRLNNLVVAGDFAKLNRPLSVAVRSDWPQLASALQKGLDSITAEEREQTLARHIPVATQTGLDPQKTLRTALLVGIPTLLTLLLAGWMLLRLRREVVRRQQAEAAARAEIARRDLSQRRLRQITDAVRGVIFQCRPDPSGGHGTQFVFISQGIQDMAGVSWEEAMRHPEKVYACVLREDRAAVQQLSQRALKKGESCDCIARVHRPGGAIAWTRIVAVPSTGEDGQPVWNGFWIDITEAHEAAEKSASVERLLSDITTSLPGVVFQIRKPPNAEFRMSYVSQNIRQRVGVSAESATGGFSTSFGHVHPDDLIKIPLALQKSADSSQPMYLEVRVLNRPDGRKGPEDWQVLRCEAELRRMDDGELVWTGYALNASSQIALEAALREARMRAEAASRAKSEFLANMSHEIRTPMNAVIGFTYLALQTQLNSQQHDYIHKAHDAAQSLLGVINDILDLSKVEAGRLGLEAAPFDLQQVLDRLSSLLAQRAQDKGLEFLIHVEDRVPGLLVGDALRLGQVLVNVVGNAIKFTNHGQVLVKVAPEPGPAGCITLAFTVSDTGIGISPAQQQKLFTPFEQADASITREYGGTGLGLSISRRLVELMGGQISVQSALGEGTRVRFTCAFQADAGAAKLPAASPQRERLLVVDDNASAREIALSYLRGFGFTVEAADSGAEALSLAAGEPFQLALIDWQMPGMDGLVLAAQLRLLQPPPRVLLLTAHGHDSLNPPPPGLLDGVLQKPINPSQLLNAVLAALRPGSKPAEGEPEVVRVADSWSLQGVRLLLVEDNLVNQQVAAEVLRGFGAEVTLAADGYEALAAVQAENFDLVLMDTQMPGMDGLAATRAIRALPGRARLPIVAMTAAARELDRQRCLSAGMDAFVPKPFQPAELRELLLKLLAERRATDDAPPALPFDPSATIPAPELDGLLQVQDRAAALERLGSTALLADISRKFFAQTPQPAKDLALMAAKGRYTDAAILLHSLAGAAGSLGYMPLMHAAKALEVCFHPNGSGDYGVPLARFAEAWDQALAAFAAQQR